MKLFRQDNGDVLIREEGQQFYSLGQNFYTLGDLIYYVDNEGWPVDNKGNKLKGNHITKFVYSPDEYAKEFDDNLWWVCPYGESVVIQSDGRWSCMKGKFLNMSYSPFFEHPKNPKYNMKARVVINDGDDGHWKKYYDSNEEARNEFEMLKELAPWSMTELEGFGFEIG